jgi:hypothetical protein
MYEEVIDDDAASSTFTVASRHNYHQLGSGGGGLSKHQRMQQRFGGGGAVTARQPSAWKERISDPEFHAIRLYNRETAQWERVYFYDNQYVKQGRIRHAISGNYFDIRAGELAENLLFKVCISMQKEPYTLFFHTPVEYERHFCVELSRELKANWIEKQEYYYRMLAPPQDEGSGESGEVAAVIVVK